MDHRPGAAQAKAVKTAGRRQVRPTQGRLDVRPIAEEIAAAILAGRPDERLKRNGEDHVRLLIGRSCRQARRSRKRWPVGGTGGEAVAALIVSAGWKMVKANVFEKAEKEKYR